MPAISAIVPTFNRAEMVCRCVQSILDTEWPELEVIVVDDCSPDETMNKVKERFGDGCDCEQLNTIADIDGIRGLVPTCSPDPQFAGTPPT